MTLVSNPPLIPSARSRIVKRLGYVRGRLNRCKDFLRRHPRDVKANERFECLFAEVEFLQSLFEEGAHDL